MRHYAQDICVGAIRHPSVPQLILLHFLLSGLLVSSSTFSLSGWIVVAHAIHLFWLNCDPPRNF